MAIVIKMFWADHPPPHFHAIYGEHEALIAILTSEIIAGSLPRRAQSLVSEWTTSTVMSYLSYGSWLVRPAL